MGYFTLKLGDRKASVRFGPVKKMKQLSHNFRRKKLEEDRMAYIVTMYNGGTERAFYIVKTSDGRWANDYTDMETKLLSDAIDQYENQNLLHKV